MSFSLEMERLEAARRGAEMRRGGGEGMGRNGRVNENKLTWQVLPTPNERKIFFIWR